MREQQNAEPDISVRAHTVGTGRLSGRIFRSSPFKFVSVHGKTLSLFTSESFSMNVQEVLGKNNHLFPIIETLNRSVACRQISNLLCVG